MKSLFYNIIAFLFLPLVSLAQLPQPDHIVIVIEENHGYNQIIGSNAAPYINSLVDDTLSVLFTNSHGITHPSQPNYLWLFSGDNQGVTNDNVPTDTPFTALNLGAELLSSGQTFAGYSEDLPFTGFQGTSSGAYARKHNPWVNWQNANSNGIPWTLNESFTEFPSDYSLLPKVSFVIPNQNNDMHNGSDPAKITVGDTWLHNHLDGYIQWAKTHNSLMIITFDEDDFTSSNWIPTLFIGEMIEDGEYDEHISHLNILRTIEDMYDLNYAGSSGDSSAITNCWKQIATSIRHDDLINNSFMLGQNYPNPFNPTTTIKFTLAETQQAELKVYDVLGNEVVVLFNGIADGGKVYESEFNGVNISSGIYFYRLATDNKVENRKMILLK